MAKLTQKQRRQMVGYLESGQEIPDDYKHVLFPPERREYELVYAGKDREEDIIANTWGVPLQAVKIFNLPKKDPRPVWTNRLIFGDNLQVMKRLLNDPEVKGKVKLVYIDPPFATKQDFHGSQDQRAYQDKIAGAAFLEFLRRRLVLIRDLLSVEGAMYLHLDWKRAHYAKVLVDEIFGETRFENEIVWHYSGWNKRLKTNFNRRWDAIFFYSRSGSPVFNSYAVPWESKEEYVKARKQELHIDSDGREYVLSDAGKGKRVQRFIEEALEIGRAVDDVWDLDKINNSSKEHTGYPTQKPEILLERIISASSNEGDLVLDAFAGSGTTLAVAEKLARRWIGIDCGKLAVYTMQKRLMNLRQEIGNKGKVLKAKPFTLFNAGLYDFKRMSELPWDDYRLFALQLFQVRDKKHTLAGIELDGFKNDADVLVFNFKQDGDIVVDEEYVEELHDHIGGRARDDFYIIAPASRVTFLEDYLDHGNTRYYILRIPYSIIDELHDRPFEQIRQPADELEINNTVEAVGFDFIIPPTAKACYKVETPQGAMFATATIAIQKFTSEAMTKKPRHFENRDTLSMVMVDYDYKGNGEDVFDLDAVFYRDAIEKDGWKVRLDASQFGERIMIIYMDIFGNELREIKTPSDFGIKAHGKTKRETRKPNKITARKKTAKTTTTPKSVRKTTKETPQRGK